MRIGCKYRSATAREGAPVFECVYVTDVSKLNATSEAVAVLKWLGGAERAVYRCFWHEYVEYVEPRREFFNAYKRVSDETFYTGPFPCRELANGHTMGVREDRYGILELIHHSDTKVESIFHLVKK